MLSFGITYFQDTVKRQPSVFSKSIKVSVCLCLNESHQEHIKLHHHLCWCVTEAKALIVQEWMAQKILTNI